MIELNYAKIDLDEDIPCHKFNKHSQMIDFIDKNCYQRDKIVWLLAKDESKDVFISESQLSIQNSNHRVCLLFSVLSYVLYCHLISF